MLKDTGDQDGSMQIAVASGKGGTGKTTLSVSLSLAIEDPVVLLDCDVEEPNVHIFLSEGNSEHLFSEFSVMIPMLEQERCIGCAACAQACQFNAIAMVRQKPLIFPDLCHSCGGCFIACPSGAILEISQSIGSIESFQYKGISVVSGKLTIGRAMASPLIRAVKKRSSSEGITIIDSPPGTSCSMITAVKNSDYIILVTEPTPFGLHDLTLAVETVRMLGIPFGVVINRSDSGDDRVVNYCTTENIALLMQIPENRAIAQAYSVGIPMVSVVPGMLDDLRSLVTVIRNTARKEC